MARRLPHERPMLNADLDNQLQEPHRVRDAGGINLGGYQPEPGAGQMTVADIRVTEKHEAYQFLKGLRNYLNANLPLSQQMRKEVRDLVTKSRKVNNQKHLKNPESAFTNHFLIPRIFDVVSKRVGKDKARQCMLLRIYSNEKRLLLGYFRSATGATSIQQGHCGQTTGNYASVERRSEKTNNPERT